MDYGESFSLINDYQTEVYDLKGMSPRNVNSDFTLQMAKNAIANLNSLKIKINYEISTFNNDITKCNSIIQIVAEIKLVFSIVTDDILSAQKNIEKNFIVDGTVPGLSNSIEGAKQMSKFLDGLCALETALSKKLNEFNNSIDALNICYEDCSAAVNDNQNKISEYYASLKNKK